MYVCMYVCMYREHFIPVDGPDRFAWRFVRHIYNFIGATNLHGLKKGIGFNYVCMYVCMYT